MNNMSISMGKRQLVDSIWKSAGIEGLGTTFSIPYDEIDNFKELLVEYYESNDSGKIKHFFREKCLLMNPKWKPVE